MPVATVSNKTVKHDLKSCPGGWVELKQLNYEQMLTRRDNAMKMFQEGQGQNSSRINLQIANKWTTLYDFRNCIVNHNLEDEEGNKLDLSNPLILQVLDPKIGAEIEQYLMVLNQDVTEEELDSFFSQPTTSSTDKRASMEPPENSELS